MSVQWKGAGNKCACHDGRYAMVYLTVDGDYCWQVHKEITRTPQQNFRGIYPKTLLHFGRTQTERESIELAEKHLTTAQKGRQ